MKSNRKRGWYVRYNGDEYCVTGKRQSAATAAKIPAGRRLDITRWDGSEWTDTGLVLVGQRTS